MALLDGGHRNADAVRDHGRRTDDDRNRSGAGLVVAPYNAALFDGVLGEAMKRRFFAMVQEQCARVRRLMADPVEQGAVVGMRRIAVAEFDPRAHRHVVSGNPHIGSTALEHCAQAAATAQRSR